MYKLTSRWHPIWHRLVSPATCASLIEWMKQTSPSFPTTCHLCAYMLLKVSQAFKTLPLKTDNPWFLNTTIKPMAFLITLCLELTTVNSELRHNNPACSTGRLRGFGLTTLVLSEVESLEKKRKSTLASAPAKLIWWVNRCDSQISIPIICL